MPLYRNFEDRTGLFRNNAFIVVSRANIDWTHKSAIVQLDLFSSSDAWLQKKEPFGTELIAFSPSPDELGKTFDDFFSLIGSSDSMPNLLFAIETHVSKLSKFSGSVLVPFPSETFNLV